METKKVDAVFTPPHTMSQTTTRPEYRNGADFALRLRSVRNRRRNLPFPKATGWYWLPVVVAEPVFLWDLFRMFFRVFPLLL